MSSTEPRAVAVIGKTGAGKSTLCNALTESKEFKEGKGAQSMTVECKCMTATVRGRKITVVDTPGTRDVKDKASALAKLDDSMKNCPEGIDAFLIAMRCDVRSTDEEFQAIEDAVDAFGPESDKRAIIVFTRGGEYENNEVEFLKIITENRKQIPRLDALLNKFGNRWVLMDNGSKCEPEVKERQMSNLLTAIDSVAQQNTKRYKKEDLEEQRKKKIEEEEKRKKRKKEKKDEEWRRDKELSDLQRKVDLMELEARMMRWQSATGVGQSAAIILASSLLSALSQNDLKRNFD